MFQKQLIFIFLFIIFSFCKESNACESDCVIENSWAIGVGVGIGEQSSPLYDGKSRNIAVLPSFYYYSEKFYIENTEIGYVLEENNDWIISLKGKFNNDGLYFKKSRIDSLIVAGFQLPGNFGEPEPENVSVNDVDRDYSYLAGISGQYHLNDNINFSLSAYHDVSSIHHGYALAAAAQYVWSKDKWRFQTGLGVNFSDDDLNNYYYGLRAQDSTSYAKLKLGSNRNIGISSSVSYRLSENFSIIGQYRYQWLGSGMTISPLVEGDHTTMFFIGISGQYGSN